MLGEVLTTCIACPDRGKRDICPLVGWTPIEARRAGWTALRLSLIAGVALRPGGFSQCQDLSFGLPTGEAKDSSHGRRALIEICAVSHAGDPAKEA